MGTASLLLVLGCTALRPKPSADPSEPPPSTQAQTQPQATEAPGASAGAMPPATPKKPGCLDSTRGAKHTFVGKLEKHPDGSGAVRVRLAKKVCFSGGRFSAGDTDEVILDIDDAQARPLLAKKVKVSGTSQDFAPLAQHAYVMRLEVTSLVATK